MKELTARYIAEETGVSMTSVQRWYSKGITPEAVAERLRELSKGNFLRAASFNELAQRQAALARKLEAYHESR